MPILDSLAPELAAHKLRAGGSRDRLVFELAADRPFYPSTVRNRALAAWSAANAHREPADQLAPIGLHEARHTCALVLIASGANPKVIPKVMGHATIGMTVRSVRTSDARRARRGSCRGQRLPGTRGSELTDPH